MKILPVRRQLLLSDHLDFQEKVKKRKSAYLDSWNCPSVFDAELAVTSHPPLACRVRPQPSFPPPRRSLPRPQALEYLFKFIVQSRLLYSRATCGMEEEQFRSSVQELFQSIRFVLSLDSRSSETLLFTQVCAHGGSSGWQVVSLSSGFQGQRSPARLRVG